MALVIQVLASDRHKYVAGSTSKWHHKSPTPTFDNIYGFDKIIYWLVFFSIHTGGGMYHCVHSITDGQTTFLAVWNNDMGVSNPFGCFVSNIEYTIFAFSIFHGISARPCFMGHMCK
jgi:hypothetical protein